MKRFIVCSLVLLVGSAGYSLGQTPTLPNQRTPSSWNPFNWFVDQKPKTPPRRYAQPMVLYPRSNSILDFFPNLPTITNNNPVGYSVYPTREQLPGPDYLRAFGYKHGGQR